MRVLSAALAAALVLAVPAAAQTETGTPSAPPGMMSGPGIDTVTLRPGDAVKVVIWREPDLSGEFPVDVYGRVNFALLGEMEVTGIPVRALRDTLMAQYRVHVRSPSITITPLRRITITGEVQRPGLYGVDPTISLGGAVALAGGSTANGDINRIMLIRAGQERGERIGAAQTLTNMGVSSGDQVIVLRRGWFDRNSAFLVSALLSLGGIIVSLIASRGNNDNGSEP